MVFQKTSVSNLWQQLQHHDLVSGLLPEIDYTATPWTIRVMQGFSGWVAAILLLIFIASVFSWLFRGGNEIILICLGLMGCTIAYLLFRSNRRNEFLTQLSLAISLTGQIMVVVSLFEWFSYKHAWIYLLTGGFQVLLAVVMPNFIHRVLSSWFAMILIFWGLNHFGVYGLGVASVALTLTVIMSNENRWGKYYSLWEPIVYGLSLSLVQFNGHLLFRENLLHLFEKESSVWLIQVAPWIATALVGVTFLYLIFKLLNQYQINLTSKIGVVSIVGGIILILTGLPVMGASSALLILLLGFMSQRRVLIGLGIISLLSFVSWYYYNLNTTLLLKSFILMAAGLVLLAARVFMRFLFAEKKSLLKQKNRFFVMSIQKWIVIAGVIASLALVNISIYQKEHILKNGKMVLLELAPVDPRSLMQGDFMRLRFSVERIAFTDSVDRYERDGFIVVNVDQHFVGHFDRFDDGNVLSKKQVKMQYRIRNRKVQFATNAFFFQEGRAEEFSKAKYGEFRVSSDGTLLLNALRDEDYGLLGESLP